MKLEKAYSLDINKIMTAVDADYHYQRGNIRSKFSFRCPDPNCDAQVTCANLNKPKDERILDPYYKVVSEHSSRCNIAKDTQVKKGTKTVYDDGYSEADEYVENTFRLNLRSLNNTQPESDKTDDDDKPIDSVRGARQTTDTSAKRKQQRRRTVSSLVASFLNDDDFEVQLPGSGVFSLRDLFIEIDGQQISEFEDDMRIYYGKARINKSPNSNGFSVRFTNVLQYGELSIRPSFFISNSLIEQCGYKKFQQAALEALATRNPIDIYLLSAVGPYLHKSGEYINFRLEGFDYLEYRGD